MALNTHEEVISFLEANEAGETLYEALPDDVKEDILVAYIEKNSHRELAEIVLRYTCIDKDNLAIDLVDRVEGCL